MVLVEMDVKFWTISRGRTCPKQIWQRLKIISSTMCIYSRRSKDILTSQPCHEKTATFDPDGKVYWWFFTSSVPNISAKPDVSCKAQNTLHLKRQNYVLLYIVIYITIHIHQRPVYIVINNVCQFMQLNYSLYQLDVPNYHLQLDVRDYFQGHSHCTKFDSRVSAFLEIHASVFQGSALGPASYVITAADLRTRHHENRLLKYADDTYLIVPAVVSYTVEEELNHIAEWSRANNLRLNQSKSQEIIFIAPGVRRTLTILPDPIQGIKRLESIKVLGVIINDQLTTSDHVTELTATCARTLYAIRTLKAHGLI